MIILDDSLKANPEVLKLLLLLIPMRLFVSFVQEP